MQMQMIERAQAAIQTPEVEAMIQRLSEFGLGVFMPHMHTDEGFAPLPKGMVQLEEDQVVSFLPDTHERVKSAVPVGWTWDETNSKVIASCSCGGAPCPGHIARS
jgi:hypothetical protein